MSRYHLGADDTARIRTLQANVEKKYVTETAGDAAYGQSGGVPIDALPLTDLDLAHESRITEDQNLRFSMPVSVMGRLRKRNRGGKVLKIGDQEVGYVRGQGIELVNLGEAGRVKKGELGHWICSVCGAAKTPYAVPAEVAQFLKIHKRGAAVKTWLASLLRCRLTWTCSSFTPLPMKRKESTLARRYPHGGDPPARHGDGRRATADRAEVGR